MGDYAEGVLVPIRQTNSNKHRIDNIEKCSGNRLDDNYFTKLGLVGCF